MVGGATFCPWAPVARAQGPIRVESNEVLVPAVVFDRKLDALLEQENGPHALSDLVAHNPHFWDSILIRDLVAKDFHLFEDGQEQPVHRAALEPPTFSIVRDSMGAHPENIGLGGGRWSYPDQPEKDIGVWFPWPQYLIAFVPQPSAVGSCHRIQVRVGRPNLVVWTRSEYCNTKHPLTDPLNGTAFGKKMEADLAAAKPDKIHLALQVVSFLEDTGATRVYIELEFPWESLHHEYKNDTLYATIGVMGMVYRKDGSAAARFSDFACCDYGSDNGSRSASAQTSGDSSHQGIAMIPNRYETQIDLPPGEYDVRVVLSDGEKFGRQQMPLSVDSVDGKDLAISDVALCTRIREAPGASPQAPAGRAGNYILPISKGVAFTPATNPRFKKNKPLYSYFCSLRATTRWSTHRSGSAFENCGRQDRRAENGLNAGRRGALRQGRDFGDSHRTRNQP